MNHKGSTLARRYQQAWQVASQACQLLQDQFKATRVAVFGSLLHPDLFNEQSDVDLAVWGLIPAQYDEALAAIEAVNSDFSIDLLEMEQATGALGEQVQQTVGMDDVITQEKDYMGASDIGRGLLSGGQEVALAARIRSALVDIGQAVDKAERLLTKARASGDSDWFDGIALNLYRAEMK